MALHALDFPGADLALDPHFLTDPQADRALADLQQGIAWEQHTVQLFGRRLPAPRLSCWIGDPGTAYRYSGRHYSPRAWPAPLQLLRDRIGEALAARFNSVLANLYRDGNDCMGWHSDDEPELGAQPLIASLSLGASRRFLLRSRAAGSRSQALQLDHGSLLVMSGDCQRNYRHCLPRTTRPSGPRLNLTFRWLATAAKPIGG